MLVKGDVCDECNNRLSVVDKAFKKNSPMTAFAYQVDDFKQGRKRNPDAIKRHEKEKKIINLDNGGSIIESKVDAVGSCRTNFTNVDFSYFDKHFSRSIHKCVANALFVIADERILGFTLSGCTIIGYDIAILKNNSKLKK